MLRVWQEQNTSPIKTTLDCGALIIVADSRTKRTIGRHIHTNCLSFFSFDINGGANYTWIRYHILQEVINVSN